MQNKKKKTDFQIFPQKNMKFIIFFLKIVRFVFYEQQNKPLFKRL